MSSALYMLIIIVLMQIFQFVPAKPLFGPVYHHVAFLLPPLFPLVLIVPAAAVDTILYKSKGRTFPIYLLLATVFVVLFNGTNWLVSFFLESRWAANRFFAGHLPVVAFEEFPRVATRVSIDVMTIQSLLIALAISVLTCWAAFKSGEWLRRVVR